MKLLQRREGLTLRLLTLYLELHLNLDPEDSQQTDCSLKKQAE
jgi:hypothetical protein